MNIDAKDRIVRDTAKAYMEAVTEAGYDNVNVAFYINHAVELALAVEKPRSQEAK